MFREKKLPAGGALVTTTHEAVGEKALTLLSVVIPARDEEGCIASTVEHLHLELRLQTCPTRSSSWMTAARDAPGKSSATCAKHIPELAPCKMSASTGSDARSSTGSTGCAGDAAVIMMADESDDCRDVVRYWQLLNEGYDCVFGSRFMRGGGVIDYPWFKLRSTGWPICSSACCSASGSTTRPTPSKLPPHGDRGCRPLISPHFNLTVELPLKAIVRGYTWKVVPITWRNRRTGEAKLKIKEMGSRYLFICLYMWLEKFFSRGDYARSKNFTA